MEGAGDSVLDFVLDRAPSQASLPSRSVSSSLLESALLLCTPFYEWLHNPGFGNTMTKWQDGSQDIDGKVEV